MSQPILLNVGTNFDTAQILHFAAQNKRFSEVQVSTVFGSLRTDVLDIRSARPDFRIRPTTLTEFEKYVEIARAEGIGVEYAANAALYSSVEELAENREAVEKNLKYLEEVGITRLIVSNPLMMEIASQATDLPIKASTILGINRPSALSHYRRFRVDSVCTDIYINRDLPLLCEMQREGEKLGIAIELLANEICFFGDVPCSNVLRNTCYQHSSMGGNEATCFGGWPFSHCQAARREHPSCWLKIPYILPQHMKRYVEKTGIRRFKISGRTNSQQYLFTTLERYMSQSFSGRIPELFMLPQNTVSQAEQAPDVARLDELDFFERWLDGKRGCDYRCFACRHCEHTYEML